MSSAPSLSIVVPTHDRRAMLTRLLDALARGGVPAAELEVIVVADGCTDDTLAALAARRDPFALRVLVQTPAGGPGRARDLGARSATGQTLLFIDDDIEPLAGALAAHRDFHAAARARGDESLVIGAPIPVRARRPDFHAISAWGWWEQQFERMSEHGHRFRHEEIFTGLLSVSASAYHAVGGFDAAFSDCHEDWELGLRLFRRGVRVAFSREAGGIHHDLRGVRGLSARKRDEGRADVLLAERSPELWPALRLSRRAPRPWTPLGALHRLAFAAPRAGDVLAALLAWLLGPLERLRLRASWRAAQAGVMYYHYWRGAAARLGDRARLLALAASHEAATDARPDDPALEIDLRDGIEAAERAIDAARPTALRVRLDDHDVGLVPAVAGAEPLRGDHLRRLLALDLAWPLSVALEMSEAHAMADTGALS